jgi:hypothetical protein
VSNNEADMWYKGTGKVTTHVIAPSHFTTTKNIYKNARSFDKGGILHVEDFEAINPLRDCFDKVPLIWNLARFFVIAQKFISSLTSFLIKPSIH